MTEQSITPYAEAVTTAERTLSSLKDALYHAELALDAIPAGAGLGLYDAAEHLGRLLVTAKIEAEARCAEVGEAARKAWEVGYR